MKWIWNKNIWSFCFYAWLVALIFFTSMSFPDAIKNESASLYLRLDYLEHFFLYFAITALYFLSKGAYLQIIVSKPYIIITLGVLFAILTEVQQLYIPGRSFNPVDLILNISGLLAGISSKKFILRLQSHSY